MESKLTWAQTTGMPAKAPNKSPYSYSKEVLLSYFSTPLPIPPALLEVPFVCSVETLVPMANLPLSEVEKKLIGSANINAETKQRQNHEKNRKTANRKGEIGYNHYLDAKSVSEDEIISPTASTQDLWDMPMGIGGFGSDGVFQDATRKLPDGAIVEKELLKSSNDLIERNLDSNSVKVPFTTKAFHSNSHDLVEPVQRIMQSDLSNHKVSQESPMVLHDARSDMYSRPAPVMPRIPPFNFTPQSWMYRDPSGILQGPFSSQQMQDWYSEGFFPPDLPIKHVEDPGFVTISALVSRFGSKVPFLAELEESHAMSRLIYERRVAAMLISTQQQDQLRYGMGYQNNANTAVSNNVIKADHNATSWGIPSLSVARPAWEDTKHSDPIVAPPQRQITHDSVPAAAIGSRPETVEATPPKNHTLPLEEKLEKMNVSPSAPMAKTNKAVVDPMALPPKPKPLSPASADKKRVEKPIKPEEVSPIKSGTSMAPWAKSGNIASGQATSSKINMKDIQDKEEMRRFQLEQERQKKADENILAQASAIMKAEARNTSSKLDGPVWGATVSKPAALKFSEIMVEENLQKTSNTDPHATSKVIGGGAKRYADLVNSPVVGHVSKAARPQAVPASTQVKNVVASKEVISSGWQTVGKGGHVVPPPASARPAHAAPAPLQASPHSGIVLPAKPQVVVTPAKPALKPKSQASTASPAFTNWFFAALKSIPPSSGVNVNDFFFILQSISVNDKTFITNICDDTLGGIPSIDTRKFGEEYLRRRQADEKVVSSTEKDESSFTVVTKKKKKSVRE